MRLILAAGLDLAVSVRLSKIPTRIALCVWAIAATVVAGALTSFHQPFNLPSTNIIKLASHTDYSGWRAIHFLSPACGCSQKVIAHLLARGPFTGVREEVMLVDDMGSSAPENKSQFTKLQAAGFRPTLVETRNIPVTYGLRGVPLLLLIAPGGTMTYMGGYGPSKNQIQDEEIFRHVSTGDAQKSFPVIGCAISADLKRRLDPLRMKY